MDAPGGPPAAPRRLPELRDAQLGDVLRDLFGEDARYDLALDPNEMRNVASEPHYAGVRDELASRLDRWMQDTSDPLLDGPVPAPPGAAINTRDQVSADEPPVYGALPA